MAEEEVDIVEGEPCPFCHTNNLTLMERILEIPYFGVTHVFSMECQNCDYQMSDLEAEEQRKPLRISYEVRSEKDLAARLIKSSSATVKIPRMVEIKPGPDSQGYITNIEGLLKRVKTILDELSQDDDKETAKKAKGHLKKLQRVMWGRETMKIMLDDPSGNSAIITEKGEVS